MTATSRVSSSADRGSVTAELAVALPAVVLMLGVVVALVGAGVSHLQTIDAARAGARAAALGEGDAVVVAAARRVGGGPAEVTVVREDGWATVTVRVPVTVAGLGVGPLEASGSATAWIEP